MNQKYIKPVIEVEVLSLDMPIAANCIADFEDVKSLIEVGCFLPDSSCETKITEDGQLVEILGEDTVCYHSNVQTAFLS